MQHTSKQVVNWSGYFGASEFDCAKVPVGHVVNAVRIFLPGPQPSLLSLDGIAFYRQGQRVELDVDGYRLSQSSVHQERGPHRLLDLKRIHTLSEPEPYWQIDFEQPLKLDEVWLFNRRDIYANRNADLCVQYQLQDSSWMTRAVSNPPALSDLVHAAWQQSDANQKVDALWQFLLQGTTLPTSDGTAWPYAGSKHFGATEATAALVSVSAKVSVIELAFEDDSPRFLSLDGIEFLHAGQRLVLDPDSYQLEQSSTHKGRGPERLLQHKRIHTLQEKSPFWRISFAEPIALDAIRLINRNDTYSRRNMDLVCRIKSDVGITTGFPLQCAALLVEPLWQLVSDKEQADHWTNLLAHGIQSKVIDLYQLDWFAIMNYLEPWSEKKAFSQTDALLFAAYAIAAAKQGQYKLRALEARLRTAAAIDVFQSALDALAKQLGVPQYRVTKHGLIRANLLAESDAYLAAIDAFLNDLRTLDYQAFIAYGTLLGARRENAFLAHDDDVDIAVALRATNEADARLELRAVLKRLVPLGYRIKPVEKFSNVHVTKKGHKRLDIFPCWSEQGQSFLLMEKMKVRALPEQIIFPLAQIPFQQYQFACPADTDAFLAERYGASWQTPDKFHEWPWKLKPDASCQVCPPLSFIDLNALLVNVKERLKPYTSLESGWLLHSGLAVIDCESTQDRLAFDVHAMPDGGICLVAFSRLTGQPVALNSNGVEAVTLAEHCCRLSALDAETLASQLARIIRQSLAADELGYEPTILHAEALLAARKAMLAFDFQQSQQILTGLLKTDWLSAVYRDDAEHLLRLLQINQQQYEVTTLPITSSSLVSPWQMNGHWQLAITPYQNMAISGSLTEPAPQVYLFFNGYFVKSVMTQSSGTTFSFTLHRSAVKSLPEVPDIVVMSSSGFLLRQPGSPCKALFQQKNFTGGDGLFYKKLAQGLFMNKKGQLKPPFSKQANVQTAIANCYQKYNDYFEKSFGYKLWLTYGTLLGQIREGGLIAHDDDFDVAYLSKHDNPADVMQEMLAMCRQMISDGLDVTVSQNGILKPKAKVSADIYAAWFQGGKLFMQNTTCLNLQPSELEPYTQVHFCGVTAWVPAKPDAFLQGKYGENWRVPDPSYRRKMAPGAADVLAIAKPSDAEKTAIQQLRNDRFS